MKNKILILASLATILVGCGGDPVAEVNQQIQAIKDDKSSKIESIPTYVENEPGKYESSLERSPFLSNAMYRHILDYKPRIVKIDLNRKKYPLEQFSLESLQMSGVLSKGAKLDAMIQTPDGDFAVVKVGEYIGQNNGRITRIRESDIEIIEAIPDELGNYIERPASLKKVEAPVQTNN